MAWAKFGGTHTLFGVFPAQRSVMAAVVGGEGGRGFGMTGRENTRRQLFQEREWPRETEGREGEGLGDGK